MQVDWELSQSLESDGQGVRAICVLPALPSSSNNTDGADATTAVVDEFRLITGNQAGGLTEFSVPSGNLKVIPFQHNHSVTALLSSSSWKQQQPTDDQQVPQGFYVTGCKDAAIRLFQHDTHELLGTLTGHEKPVTSLAWLCDGDDEQHYLLSGSWDGTAKIWNVARKCVVATLSGHENSVCVASLGMIDNNNKKDEFWVVTGSAGIAQNNRISDHAVRLWSVNVTTGHVSQLHHVANDHQGPIRDILSLTKQQGNPDSDQYSIATCSNDGTVKLRSSNHGAVANATLTFLPTVSEHPPMLLSIATVVDPATSTISALVASAEDGHVVAWDVHSAAEADSSSCVSTPQVIRHPVCVWRVLGLPNGDFCTCSQDGKVRIFTKASERMAPTAERQAFLDGVTEALQKQSGGPSAEEIAKLPNWENNLQLRGKSEGQVQIFQKNGIAIAAQWSAVSQTWIEVGQVMGSPSGSGGSDMIDGVRYDHVLPIEVDTEGGGVARLQIGYNTGENPFVAAQRFIDAHVLPQYHLNDIATYIEQRTGSGPTTLGPAATASNNSGAANRMAATTGVPIANYEYVPAKTYKIFELSAKTASTTFEKMKTKLESFNKLSPDQMERVGRLMETLSATNRYHATKIPKEELQVIDEMLTVLSPAEAFPALDLARMTVLHPDATSSTTTNVDLWRSIITKALELCSSKDEDLGPAIPMLSLRLFANAFKGGPGSLQVVSAPSTLDSILSCTESHCKSSNKNIRLSVVTVLHNVCFYLNQTTSSSDTGNDTAVYVVWVDRLITLASNILINKSFESEAILRTLVAVGTLLMAGGSGAGVSTSSLATAAKQKAVALFLAAKVEPAASPHDVAVKKAAKEVYTLLA